MSSEKPEVRQAGCGGLGSAEGGLPRVDPRHGHDPGDEDPTVDKPIFEDPTVLNDLPRDASTNRVGPPIYELPTEAGRTTWGWDQQTRSPAEITAAMFLLTTMGRLPYRDILLLADQCVGANLNSLSDEDRQLFFERLAALKSRYQS